jgi:hypothetical protein
MDQKQNFPGDSNNKLVDGILRNCPETFYEEFADHNPVLSCKVRFARITSGIYSFSSFIVVVTDQFL